jgi:carboxyl-terminal processing protease
MPRIAIALLVGASLWAAAPPPSDDAGLEREVKRVIDIYSIMESNAADPVNPEQAFYQGAIPGLLRKLDPHSVFFDPNQFEQLKQMQSSTRKGFGSVVSLLPGRVIVLQTLPGTPSARSGMSPGDEILAINNIRLDRLELEQLIQLLGEAHEQPANLVVRRPGTARLMELRLIPEEMQSPSVERAFLLRPGMGYLRVGSFDEATGRAIKDAIEKLGGRNLHGLVLDLRNNPGGLVTAATETASLFLKPGQTILSIRGRKSAAQNETVQRFAEPYTFAMSVIVNGKSASASEIVAGALQDHDRAVIVGEPSFGKGLVQSVFPLSSGTGIALTTALYYTPSGRSIQKPLNAGDYELGETSSHLNQDKQFHTDKGRTVHGGGGITPDVVVFPASITRLRAVLEASGSFVSFATEYLAGHKVDSSFTVTPALLDQFQAWLTDHRIQPSFGEWASERDFAQIRLKAEIFNQALGVDKGDEVEALQDAQILKAIEALQ